MLVHTACTYTERGLLIAPFGRSRFGANGKPIGLLRPVPDDICISKKGLVSTPAKSGHPTNLRAGALQPLLPHSGLDVQFIVNIYQHD